MQLYKTLLLNASTVLSKLKAWEGKLVFTTFWRVGLYRFHSVDYSCCLFSTQRFGHLACFQEDELDAAQEEGGCEEEEEEEGFVQDPEVDAENEGLQQVAENKDQGDVIETKTGTIVKDQRCEGLVPISQPEQKPQKPQEPKEKQALQDEGKKPTDTPLVPAGASSSRTSIFGCG